MRGLGSLSGRHDRATSTHTVLGGTVAPDTPRPRRPDERGGVCRHPSLSQSRWGRITGRLGWVGLRNGVLDSFSVP